MPISVLAAIPELLGTIGIGAAEAAPLAAEAGLAATAGAGIEAAAAPLAFGGAEAAAGGGLAGLGLGGAEAVAGGLPGFGAATGGAGVMAGAGDVLAGGAGAFPGGAIDLGTVLPGESSFMGPPGTSGFASVSGDPSSAFGFLDSGGMGAPGGGSTTGFGAGGDFGSMGAGGGGFGSSAGLGDLGGGGINLGDASAAGPGAGGGVGGGVTDWISKNPLLAASLGLGGIGIGKQLLTGGLPYEKQQKGAAALAGQQAGQLTAEGQQFLAPSLGGPLPPALEAQVTQALQDAINTTKGKYASMGLGNSTALSDQISYLQLQAEAMRGTLAQQLAQTGTALISAATADLSLESNIYAGLMAAQTQADAALGQSISGFAGALAMSSAMANRPVLNVQPQRMAA